MERINLNCSKCGKSDFIIQEHLVPSGFSLECTSCHCETPLFIKTEFGRFFAINNSSVEHLYDESYSRDISYKEAYNTYFTS